MSLCILETILRDKLENRSSNPFIQNKNHSFTSQTLIVKRSLAILIRRLILFTDLMPEAIRALHSLVEYYDIKTDQYETILLEVIDRMLLKNNEIQHYAVMLYEKLMKLYEQQRDKVDQRCSH